MWKARRKTFLDAYSVTASQVGDQEQQARGIGKQAEGKAQGAAGKVKEAAKRAAERVNKTAHDLIDHKDKDKDAA
jgi:hypothetical protein